MGLFYKLIDMLNNYKITPEDFTIPISAVSNKTYDIIYPPSAFHAPFSAAHLL